MVQDLAMAGCVLTLVEAGVFPPRQLEKVRMLLKRVAPSRTHWTAVRPANSTALGAIRLANILLLGSKRERWSCKLLLRCVRKK
jgi:hypothetical protein